MKKTLLILMTIVMVSVLSGCKYYSYNVKVKPSGEVHYKHTYYETDKDVQMAIVDGTTEIYKP